MVTRKPFQRANFSSGTFLRRRRLSAASAQHVELAMHTGQIIAIGGVGFTEAPHAPRIERYLLAQIQLTQEAQRTRPRVCFIGSASGDNDHYVARFYETFAALGCEPSHASLFRRTGVLREQLLAQHLVFVGGGNTKSLLALWRDWGLPELLTETAAAGVVLAGISAGAICWFDQGVTESWGDGLRALPGLGMLRGSCCPHYDGEAERRPAYRRLMQDGAVAEGYAIDDRAALHFRDGELLRVVADNTTAKAYRVLRQADGAEASDMAEVALPVQVLNDQGGLNAVG